MFYVSVSHQCHHDSNKLQGFFVSSDSGEYFCTSTPWYLSASTGAWTQAAELTSTRIFLTVRFAGKDCLPDTWTMSTHLVSGIYSIIRNVLPNNCPLIHTMQPDTLVWTFYFILTCMKHKMKKKIDILSLWWTLFDPLFPVFSSVGFPKATSLIRCFSLNR